MPAARVPDAFTPVPTMHVNYGDDGSCPDERDSLAAVSNYIADMCSGLIAMAGTAKFDLLSYLLGMARLEAEMRYKQATVAQPTGILPRHKRKSCARAAPAGSRVTRSAS